MKSRLLLSTAAVALLTVGSAMAQSDNRRPDDASRPQAQSQDRQRGERPSQPQARPKAQEQGRQGAQAPQRSPSTTGQAPQQPQNDEAKKDGDRNDATRSSEQQRTRQAPQRSQNSQDRPSSQGAQTRQRDDDRKPLTGQAQQDTPSTRKSTTQSRDGQGSRRSGTASSSEQGTPSGSQQQNAQQRGSASRQGASVELNEQQRTRISATISERNVRPLTNVNFSVSIGTAVPRSVRLQTLPPTIVSIVPQYRGYSYVVVEDRIVIIEPKTRKIVTTIEYSGGGKARAASRSKLELSTEQRAAIRKHATSERRATTGSRASTRITVGERVPDSIELHSFPATVYEEVPVVREYRYFVRDRDVVVVDPGEQRIIEIIR